MPSYMPDTSTSAVKCTPKAVVRPLSDRLPLPDWKGNWSGVFLRRLKYRTLLK